jgi:hypothetical protein
MKRRNPSESQGNGIPVETEYGRWAYIVFRHKDLIGVKKFSVDVETFQKIRRQPENGIAFYEEYVLGMIDKCHSDLFEKARLLGFLAHLKAYMDHGKNLGKVSRFISLRRGQPILREPDDVTRVEKP